MFSPDNPFLKPPQVIVVEDDFYLQEAICTYLNLDGFSASGVGSVQAFLAWAQTHPSYDLAVLDYDLPDGNGLDTLKFHINSNRVGAVMMAARDELDIRLDSLSAGADAYLSKPIELKELSATLRNIARRMLKTREPVWHYNKVTWELTSPDNVAMRLARGEAIVMERIAATPGEAIMRAELIRCFGADPSTYDPRRMEILVRRLRRKAEILLKQTLPLETVHGVGFAFIAQISVI
jgi:DNA-binding response OmpR family regulator